jgi:hypothetical protein
MSEPVHSDRTAGRSLGALGLIAALLVACTGAGSSLTPSAATSIGSTASVTPLSSLLPTGSPAAQPNVFTTVIFLPGMRVTTPVSGWSVGADSQTEFELYPPGRDPNDAATAIRFWIDPHPSTPCTDQDLPVSIPTPARAVEWLQSNTNLVISNLKNVAIAGNLVGLRVDLNDSAAAPKCAPQCPGPCIDYFLFHAPGITDPYGTGLDEFVQLYFAQIGPPAHLFVVGVDTPNLRVFTDMTASAAEMLASLRLPDQLPP